MITPFRLHPVLFYIILALLQAGIVSCSGHEPAGKDTARSNTTPDTTALQHVTDSTTPPVNPVQEAEKKTSERAQQLIGKILPDTEDSTLIRFVYGSCYYSGDGASYNWGPQIWNDGDSVIMHVAERLGDDNTQLIYLRGEQAITAVMHNFFNETTLLLNKTKNGWLVADAIVDEQVIDYSGVELLDTQDNRMLVRYSTSGTYAGGVMFANDVYNLYARTSLTSPSVSLITGSSNTASSQCFGEENGNDCNCYDRTGETKFSYDKTLQCFVFRYSFSNTLYECEVKNGKTTNAKQTWYMNADTAFMGSGHALGEWGESIGDFTSLPQAEIRKLLQRKK